MKKYSVMIYSDGTESWNPHCQIGGKHYDRINGPDFVDETGYDCYDRNVIYNPRRTYSDGLEFYE